MLYGTKKPELAIQAAFAPLAFVLDGAKISYHSVNRKYEYCFVLLFAGKTQNMRYFLLLITVLASGFCFGQEKIEGIGKFKIGKTSIEVIRELETELSASIETINTINDRRVYSPGQSAAIYQVLPNRDQPLMSAIHASFCATVKVYLIPNYTISGIKIKNMYLSFENDVLQVLTIDSSTEIDEALTSKYGEPALNVDKKTVNCVYKLTGATVPYEDVTYRKKWINGTIEAESTLMKYYNSECKVNYINYLTVQDTRSATAMLKCSNAERDQLRDAKKEEKKKSLKDF